MTSAPRTNETKLTTHQTAVLGLALQNTPRWAIADMLGSTRNSVKSTISQLRRRGFYIPRCPAGAKYQRRYFQAT